MVGLFFVCFFSNYCITRDTADLVVYVSFTLQTVYKPKDATRAPEALQTKTRKVEIHNIRNPCALGMCARLCV